MYRSSLFLAGRISLQRGFATAASLKPNIKLLAKLRQETEVSMTKAKEALIKNNNDYQLALNWLNQDALASGAKKAAKVADRVAGEGLIGTASVNLRSTIIEVTTLMVTVLLVAALMYQNFKSPNCNCSSTAKQISFLVIVCSKTWFLVLLPRLYLSMNRLAQIAPLKTFLYPPSFRHP